jgi:hypothetical protein
LSTSGLDCEATKIWVDFAGECDDGTRVKTTGKKRAYGNICDHLTVYRCAHSVRGTGDRLAFIKVLRYAAEDWQLVPRPTALNTAIGDPQRFTG